MTCASDATPGGFAFQGEWAPDAERALAGDLAARADGGAFTVVGTSCKTTTCVAEREYEHYDDAVATFADLLEVAPPARLEPRVLLDDRVPATNRIGHPRVLGAAIGESLDAVACPREALVVADRRAVVLAL